MKVNRDAAEFRPVTITIESQEELNLLLACLNTRCPEIEKAWTNTGRQGKLESDLHYEMFVKINELFEEEN